MKKAWKAIMIILGIIIIVYAVVQLGVGCNNIRLERENSNSQKQIEIDMLKSGYEQLKIGMTYDECVFVLGFEGDLFSETESDNLGKISIYLWKPKNTLFAGIEAHFEKGMLTSKTWMG